MTVSADMRNRSFLVVRWHSMDSESVMLYLRAMESNEPDITMGAAPSYNLPVAVSSNR